MMKRLLVAGAVVAILLPAWFLWPTPYVRWQHHYLDTSRPGAFDRAASSRTVQYRENRLTGSVAYRIIAVHGATEWETLD